MFAFTGFHGTDYANYESIAKDNFRVAKETSRYGDGIYFFVEGVSSDPKEDAKKWAIKVALWKQSKPKYAAFCVVSSEIKVETLWDLRDEEELRDFNGVRDLYVEALEEKPDSAVELMLITQLIQENEYQGIVGHMVTGFLKDLQMGIQRTVVNTTVLCVGSAGAISLDSIGMVDKGPVEK